MLGDFDRTENEVSVLNVFCRNDKVSTCSMILIEPRIRFLSLTFFVRSNYTITQYVIMKSNIANTCNFIIILTKAVYKTWTY